ncbi:hypothetical protein [Amycolatopsis jejuensis]|uniref:hypothetical protein n=1 Tax=Amycolatopsis jejuensis TaxID=330084 RepID=UPI00069034A9|nr:hypothetical protein [Amycolatopsis jejuensis]
MTTTLDPPAAPPLGARLSTWHRPSLQLAGVLAVATVACIIALLADRRTVLGAPVWAKLFKFAISGGLYFFTWSWLVSLLPARFRRVANGATTLASVLFAGEYAVMLLQAARGRPSHFGNATPLDAALFGAMGVMVTIIWVATLVVTVLLMFTKLEDRGVHWAVRTGAALSMVGAGLGALMTGPTPEEQAVIAATGHSDLVGGHSVGVAEGGPGLPLLGWSTTGGDLRIPHFVGMHALQVLPLLAFGLSVLATRVPRLNSAVRSRLVWTATAGYAGLVALVLWQAERGEPLIRPSAPTLIAAGLLVAAIAAASVAAIFMPVRKAAR